LSGIRAMHGFTRRRRLVITAISALLLLGVAWWLCWFQREPICRGHTATEWVRSIAIGQRADDPSTRAACDALRELGVVSLPAVLRELQAHDSPNWLRPVYRLYDSCGFWRLHRWNWDGPETRRARGGLALEGIAPVIGVKTLTNLMSHPNRAVHVAAAKAVCRACTGDKNVVPGLFVTAMQSPLPEMREAGLEGFSFWSVLTSEGMAAVRQCASDPNPEVRGTALRVLAYYGAPPPAQVGSTQAPDRVAAEVRK
jgi:hypothetical protein